MDETRFQAVPARYRVRYPQLQSEEKGFYVSVPVTMREKREIPENVTWPCSVNLTALPSKFNRIWRKRISSPYTFAGSLGANSHREGETFPPGFKSNHVGNISEKNPSV